MSDASWYQRKLAERRQQAPANPGMRASPQHAPVQAYPPQYPPQYSQPPQGYPMPGQQFQQPQQLPRVTTENLYEAAKFWKGGPGARANPDPCPECGSDQYFANITGSKRGPQPAGHCYNCGFNDGMFSQGQASSWGAA